MKPARTIRQVALESSGLDKAKLDQLLDARSQTEPGTGAGRQRGRLGDAVREP